MGDRPAIVAPWNASGSAEEAYEVRPCRWAGGKLAMWSPHRPGEGRPIFAKPHMVRQRRSIAEMRCTVCGERTGKGYYDRWWFGLGKSNVAGFAFVTTEAPVHRDCAKLAQRQCPHLRRLGVEPEPMPVWDAVLSAVIGGAATDRDFGVDLRGRKVIGHLKLAWRRMPVLPQTAGLLTHG